MKTKKLRRPTEFDKHQSRRGDGSSPPAKSRKTRRKQSAGVANWTFYFKCKTNVKLPNYHKAAKILSPLIVIQFMLITLQLFLEVTSHFQSHKCQ